MMLIGDGGGTADGPNYAGSERFVYMAFWSPGGGGDPGDRMSLVALEPGGSPLDSSSWTEIASGLSFDAWHTITVVCDLNSAFSPNFAMSCLRDIFQHPVRIKNC